MEPRNRFNGRKPPLHSFSELRKALLSPLTTEGTESTALLVAEREVVAILLRKNFEDYSKASENDGTVDYLVTGLLQAQNTTLWMLRRNLP